MFLDPRLAVALAIASLAALAVPGHPLLAALILDSLVLAAAALDVGRAVSPSRVLRRRLHDPVVSVGEPLEVELVTHNPLGRPIRVAVRDAAAPSLSPHPRRLFERLSPGGRRLRYTLRPTRRGRFELGPVTVRTWGPLGLGGRQRTVALLTSVKVYPELRARAQIEGRLRRNRLLEVGTKSARIRGGGLEFDSMREYHPDDEFRRINWRASARAGKPISNVFREERNQQVLLLLDAGRTMAGTVGGAPRFEHALDAAVALAALGHHLGDRVGLFTFGHGIRSMVPPRADAAQVNRIVDAVFAVDPTVTASDYRGAIGAALGRYPRRALMVLFTDLADAAALDTLVEALPTLIRRHLVVVAEVADPAVEVLARTVPRSAAESFEKAAAAAAQARREDAAVRLRGLGATVIDRPPEHLAGALADEYLRAKAFGRL